MNIACPECSTFYRVNPDRVPEGGVATRCRECGTAFRVDSSHGGTAPGEHVTAERIDGAGVPDPSTEPGGAPEKATANGLESGGEAAGQTAGERGSPAFGPQDPNTRARRLARALVSDMKVYNLEKWEAAITSGTLRKDFRDEILKSWEEYVEQVGKEMAKRTPYFRNALNEILAEGDEVF